MAVPTYVINLRSRIDRKKHIIKEFENRPEFAVEIVEAFQHEIGAIGLWNTIRHIVQDLVPADQEYIIICEDDHRFTDEYNAQLLSDSISIGKSIGADILNGGVSWFKTGIQVSRNLFWIEEFSATQFLIIYKKFYKSIIEANFTIVDNADFLISALSSKKFVISPFISAQKEFGYSDVTSINNDPGRVERLFEETAERLNLLCSVRNYYLPKFKN